MLGVAWGLGHELRLLMLHFGDLRLESREFWRLW